MRLGLHHSHTIPVLRRDCFGQQRYTPYVYIFERALRWRVNATIYKEQMQTKYSDVINFYSITAGYCCSLDPPLYGPGRPCFAFLLWLLIIVDSQVVTLQHYICLAYNSKAYVLIHINRAEEILYVLLPITLLR